MLQGANVGVGEVVDVNVIAQARAVGRRVIVAKDLQLGACGRRCQKRERDQMGLGSCSSPISPLSSAPAALK